MLLNCGVGEDFWESLKLQGDPTSPSYRRSILGVHWKDWCWSWSSNNLATWCEELTHLKRPWCWERLRAGGEGDDRGWDGWMASLTRWTWVWVNSGSWWWTGRPGVLQSMGLQRVGHEWATELNWLKVKIYESQVSRVLPKVKCSGAQPCSFVYRLSVAAFSWQPQSWGVVTEAGWNFLVTQHCLSVRCESVTQVSLSSVHCHVYCFAQTLYSFISAYPWCPNKERGEEWAVSGVL